MAIDKTRIEMLRPGILAVLGIPFDAYSSFLPGCAQAPDAIRTSLMSPSTNLSSENGIDFENEPRLVDLGNMTIKGEKSYKKIKGEAFSILEKGASLLALGGDHSITYPLVQAHYDLHGKVKILHLDAHSDTYAEFEGNPFSHACPFARIMEEGLAKRLVQVGIRTLTRHQKDQILRFGIEVIEMRGWRPDLKIEFDGPIYLSLDLDVLDPGFVPGVSHYEPGGLSTREVISLIQGLPNPILGADLVEFNPGRDPSGVTGMVAAKLLKELGSRMLENNVKT